MSGRWRWRSLAVIGVVGVFVAVEALSGSSTPDAAKQHAAPPLPTQVLRPPRQTLASLRGKPAVVHFWASWCRPCIDESPQLAALSRRLGGRARLVGVDWSDSPSGARAFVRQHHWTFPNLADRAGRSGDRWGISGLPTTFVLDARGRIVQRLTGPQTAAGLLARLPQPATGR